jgi:hypothetical protein
MGLTTLPNKIICSALLLTKSIGIANPTPEFAPEGLYIAVFIPITAPEESNNGPPLLPGLIAASV